MKKLKFQVKHDHIKLLKAMCVGWQDCGFGAPEIDPKRPYGNSSVLCDIGEIVGLKDKDEEKEWTDKETDYLYNLHREMETVLQICLVNNGVNIGTYTCEEYSNDWKLEK